MLHVALAGLLAGSLALSPPDGTGDDKKTPNADKPAAESVATPGVFETAPAEGPQTITQDTYAFGVPSDASPIKFWASYAYGEAESLWDRRGQSDDDGGELNIAGTNGDIVSQRINVGAQINFISFTNFKLGGGAQLTVSKNEFQVGSDGDALAIGDLDSGFGLQGVKVFGALRGRTLGLHGGYIFDFGDPRETRDAQVPFGPGGSLVTVALPTTLSNSDERNAVFIGGDFDLPSDRFRLFGGIDYFILENNEDEQAEDFDIGTDIVNFMLGAGVKLSVFEIGASAQIQTRFNGPLVSDIGTTEGIGGHAGTISPYLRISPPNLPVSLFVKGAVQDEYTEFGYPIGGSNSVKPSIGFTAGLTLGFE